MVKDHIIGKDKKNLKNDIVEAHFFLRYFVLPRCLPNFVALIRIKNYYKP